MSTKKRNPGPRGEALAVAEQAAGDAIRITVERIEHEQAHATDDTCVMCDGGLVYLGMLGHTNHYRCRNCGLVQNV